MRLSDTTKFNNAQLNLTYVICCDKVLFVLQHEEVTDIIYIIQNRRFLLYHDNIFPCSEVMFAVSTAIDLAHCTSMTNIFVRIYCVMVQCFLLRICRFQHDNIIGARIKSIIFMEIFNTDQFCCNNSTGRILTKL